MQISHIMSLLLHNSMQSVVYALRYSVRLHVIYVFVTLMMCQNGEHIIKLFTIFCAIIFFL